MANDVRGEVTLVLGKKEYTLRPSFEAVQAFEKKIGKGVLTLAQETASLGLVDAAIIATECIRAQGKAAEDSTLASFDADRVAELIYESEGGLTTALATLTILLTLAATGGYSASGEVKAGIAKTTAKTPAA